ncbi:MAG TPA: peptide ABC transporter substrate-binding protein [Candidatus Limnocylindrales bacterium]
MHGRDRAVVGTLSLVLVALTIAIAIPTFEAPPVSIPVTPSPAAPRVFREGIVGHPVSITPLTARSQADRDLVALLFSGLVRLGPGASLIGDLAEDWTVSTDGRTWDFRLRDDARWHDGVRVTADDVAFTIRTLQDPDYAGPAAASWRDVSVSVTDPGTVRFELQTPLGGFLQAATQPIAPEHLLGDVPVADLATNAFGQAPIGNGPFALEGLADDRAVLVPADSLAQPGPSASPTDSLASPGPTPTPAHPVPLLTKMEIRFFDDPDALAASYRSGELDAASGLPPALATELGAQPGSRVVRYPGSTLTAVALNLRPNHPAFRVPVARRALLAAIDRESMIGAAFGGEAVRADSLIPPGSWAFDIAASTPIGFDRDAARRALLDAGWRRGKAGWLLPRATKPLTVEVVGPDSASNPVAFAAAEQVVKDWKGFGIAATHVAMPPGQLVTDRLTAGSFDAAVIDIAVGLDPDLYPLLASSQTTSERTNIIGLQDPALDRLLSAARAPGTQDARATAYTALQAHLSARQYVLPLAFRDVIAVLRDDVAGPTPRQVADPSDRFWDVLAWRLAPNR